MTQTVEEPKATKGKSKKLTKRLVDQQMGSLPAQGYVFLWDSQISGFGARIWHSGKCTYLLKYRNNEGTQRKLTLGPHGVLTVEKARDMAREYLVQVRNGRDPAAEKSSARDAITVDELGNRYLSEHAEVKKRPRSVQSDKALLRLHIRPKLGPKKVHAVTRADIQRLHHEMRATRGAANRTLALLSKMFNLAEKWGFRPDGSNPCRHIEKYPERRIDRFLSNAELGRLGSVLVAAEHDRTELPSVIAAIRLLLFTGCRLSEILTLRWNHVDFEHSVLRLPESKTGPKIVYLSPPPLELFASIRREEDNPYVITGAKRGSHLVNLRKPWGRIRRKADLEDVRIHDLRHSFASMAAAGGLSLPMIGALLGHSQPATTHRYAHLAADPLKQAANLTGARIAAAMGQGTQRKDKDALP